MRLMQSDILRAYVFLKSHSPFNEYITIPSHEVKFVVTRSEMRMGEYDVDPHTIMVSSKSCANWNDVLETIAHEMVHMICELKDHANHHEHDYHFKRIAKRVCKHWGFDPKTF